MPDLRPILAQAIKSANIDPSSSTLKGNVLTSPTGQTFFVRTSTDIPQITGEYRSLCALAQTCPEVVPRVYAFEVDPQGNEAAMVSQYYDLSAGSSRGDTQRELARRIAKLHTTPPEPEGSGGHTGKYGFEVPTFCGVTEQDNTWEESWEVFYRDRRLGDMVNRIGDKQVSEAWDRLREKAVPLLLRDIRPTPRPVILHGDLWSGNKGVDSKTGEPVIYDPSSYFGHNEADLGIMHMFGGFSEDFFDEYHKIHPRSEPYYSERQKLYELYHHLNHTLMFGGGYKSGALGIMRQLSEWADEVE